MDDLTNDMQQNEEIAMLSGQSSLPENFIGKTGQGQCRVQAPERISKDNSLEEILSLARKLKASDVHFSVGKEIFFKINGILKMQTEDKLSQEAVWCLVDLLLSLEQKKTFESRRDIELVHVIEGLGRFRVSIMHKTPGIDLTIRLIPDKLYTFEETGMPETCRELLKWSQGLVLITGPIGCGKSTTLAVLCELINQTRKEHIITIESPIEIVYTPKLSQITQREIGLHTMSQNNALRSALRQDPDILLISDLRDLSTIQLAATAAETGHLVLGTMNTNDAAQTLLRLINSFPPQDKELVQNMISESLRGIICQQLIPTKRRDKLVAAYEVLVVNAAISNLIHKGNLDQVFQVIETGKAEGMTSFDASLIELVKNDVISWEEGAARSVNKREFEKIGYKRYSG
ncbi:MAG: PilT/PilU family type 4a pilus ATPase [Candidatus Omnitrophota bacterium]